VSKLSHKEKYLGITTTLS